MTSGPGDVYYVQLLYPERVEGADDSGWISVAIDADQAAAFHRAARVYADLIHPEGGPPAGVRVVSERAIRANSGDPGVAQAAGGILVMADLLAEFADHDS
jgi:hypothetical protein